MSLSLPQVNSAMTKVLSICQIENWPARLVSSQSEYTNLKEWLYVLVLFKNVFKMAHTIFRIYPFKAFLEPGFLNIIACSIYIM